MTCTIKKNVEVRQKDTGVKWNLDLHKGVGRAVIGKHMGKYDFFSYFKIALEDDI